MYAGNIALMRDVRNAYKIFVAIPEEMRQLGTLRCRWEYYIRVDLSEIGWEVVDWIHLAQDRDQWKALVKTVLNLRVP
jgi:hypothetical protein